METANSTGRTMSCETGERVEGEQSTQMGCATRKPCRSPGPTGAWTARRGFACAVALVLIAILTNEAVRAAARGNPEFPHWLRAQSRLIHGTLMSVREAEFVLGAFLFGQPLSASGFASRRACPASQP